MLTINFKKMEFIRRAYFFILDIIQTLLLVFAVFIVIYIFLFRPFQVNGDSMYPNFVHKEYVMTNIIGLRFNEPKFADVVVFRAPPDQQRDFIKRVIAVPGDKITIAGGKVYVNGSLLDESRYLESSINTRSGIFLQEGETLTVPVNSYFVMGDNRVESSDSREWGFVTKSQIIGTAFFIYWPPDKIGFIKNPYETR